MVARHAFGEGSYRYFADPLPPLVQQLREELYPPLAQIANRWAERLGERTFPATLDGLLTECAELGQHRPTPLVLRCGPGGYNCPGADAARGERRAQREPARAGDHLPQRAMTGAVHEDPCTTSQGPCLSSPWAAYWGPLTV